MGAALHSKKVQKIHFIIQKQVQFGKAVYVAGNIQQLGCWKVQQSLKLSWNKNHYWTGFIQITTNGLETPIEFKYVVANWDNPCQGRMQWEAGKRNRQIQHCSNSQHIICQNTWNMQRITLNLVVPDDDKNEQYYVTGDCKQLGNWKKSLKMKLNKNKIPPYFTNLNENNEKKKYIIHTLSFQVFRQKPKVHYYYIKKSGQKTQTSQVEKQPGRKFSLQNYKHYHPKCLKITHFKGDTQTFQVCNFKQLHYSNIKQNIYVGTYLRTPQDFKTIKQAGITSILSIQTDQDIAMQCLTHDYLDQMSKKFDISIHKYAIQDMNRKDFLFKCNGAIQLLKKLIKEGKKVYVHCTAGMYRSPQIVALFLIITQNLSPTQAVQYVKSRHPFARPNAKIVSHAVEMISKDERLQSF